MLKLTKKADYGLMAMKHLAGQDGMHAQSVKDIAGAYRIPVPLLAKILQQLTHAGLLVSRPGVNGGYALARSADAITAFEVVRAIEGPLFMECCVTVQGECDLADCCTIKGPLQKLNDNIRDLLAAMRISDLCQVDGARQHPSHVHRMDGELVTLNF